MAMGPVFRTVATLMAGLLFVQTSLAGAVTLGQEARQGFGHLFAPGPKSAQEVAVKPIRPAKIKAVPKDGKYRRWWTPSMIQRMERLDMVEAIENGNFSAALSLFGMAEPGNNMAGGGPGNSGENPANTGGTGSGGSALSSGSGLEGQTNTATGNQLSRLPLFSYPVRGDLEVGVTFYHNSMVSDPGTGSFLTDPIGRKWRHNYDMRVLEPDANTAVVEMPDGLRAPYTKVSNQWQRPEGFFFILSESNGNYILTSRDGTRFEFCEDNYLEFIRDRWGNKVEINREKAKGHRVTSVHADDNRTVNFVYGSDDSLDRIHVTPVQTVNYDFHLVQDLDDNLVQVNRPSGVPYRHFGYTPDANIEVETDGTLLKYEWQYDAQDRVIQWTEIQTGIYRTMAYNQYTTSNPYHPVNGPTITNGHASVETNENGGFRSTLYEDGRVREVVDYGGYVTSYEYHNDADANLHKVHVQHDATTFRVTTYSNYQPMGQPGTITDPEGKITDIEYNANFDVEKVTTYLTNPKNTTNPNLSLVTDYEYDSFGRLFKVRRDDEAVMQTFVYNSFGEVKEVYDAANRMTEIVYDYGTTANPGPGYGDITKIVSPGASVTEQVETTFTYSMGLPLQTRVEGELKSTVAYDNFGRSVTVQNALGHTTTIERDYAGRVTKVTDPAGKVTTNTYVGGLLTQSKNPKNEITKYNYCPAGFLISVENARGVVREYTNDSRGLVLEARHPQNANTNALATKIFVEQWQYNAVGQPIAYSAGEETSGTLVLSRSQEYTYNKRGQLTLLNHSGTTPDVTYAYDHSGRRTSMADGVGTTSWNYNDLSQLTQMSSPQGNVGYGYDSIGQMTRLKNLQTSGSLDTVYTIQPSTGRITKVTSAWNEETTFGYDDQGRLIRKVLHNGLREEMAYDAANRLERVRIKNNATDALVREETYGYNNRSLVTSHQVAGVTTTYTYDDLGLLLSETRPGYSASYVYDPNGNRTSRTRTIGSGPAEVDVYAYDQGDKLLSITRNGGAFRTYAYNGLGETTSIVENGVTTTFSWNNDGRVVGMDLPGTTNDPTFRYNGFGTRVDRTVGASTEAWKRSGAGVTASVLSDGTANFTPGISSRVGSTSTFTHAGLKNTTAQSEGLAITGTKTYDAFGLETASTGTWQTAFGYAGNFGYQKADAGMKLLGHRYYDPETGRFLSRDPIKDGRNWYGYGAGLASPLLMVDPTGLKYGAVVGELIGGTAGYAVGGPVGGAIGGFAGGLVGSLLDGNSFQDAMFDATVGGVVGALGGIAGKGAGKMLRGLKQKPGAPVADPTPPNSNPLPQVTINRKKGLEAERMVAAQFESDGWKVEKPGYINVPGAGRRLLDLLIEKEGMQYYVEVKSGGATYGGSQRTKDAWISEELAPVWVIFVP